MINGFYSSAAGMLGLLEQQDAISNNLANADTTGFKKTHIGFSAFSKDLSRATGASQRPGPVIPVPYSAQDTSQGVINDTSDPTNLAIDGPGFFVVNSKDGRMLTRGGNFTRDDMGRLVTRDGGVVMGQDGPIRLPGSDWTIDSDGSVRVNGRMVDRLMLSGETDKNTGQLATGRVVQGRIEGSNVSVVREMVSMLTALRAYEANQKSIQSIDQTLDKVISLPGRNG